MAAELIHSDRRTDGRTDGQTDMTKLTGVFFNYSNAPENLKEIENSEDIDIDGASY